jgi:hypothetical protein
MTSAEDLAWLLTPAGEAELAAAASLPDDRLTRISRLRKRLSAERAVAVVELLELRRRARAKFADPDRMLFTPEGLEQSTGDAIAQYRAAQFPAGEAMLDACCGIGGDARRLARRGPVVCVDASRQALTCARANVGLESRETRYLCADVTTLDLACLRRAGVRATLFDPSRRIDRAGGRARARCAEQYSPPLSWLNELREHFSLVAVKVSPMLEDEVLVQCGGAVEMISDRGECKEAVIWVGETARCRPSFDSRIYSATILGTGASPFTLNPIPVPEPDVSEPRAWLLEPDPAVIRAHLVPQVAAMFKAYWLEPDIAYLTADASVDSPAAACYRVLDWMPFNLKRLQEHLRAGNQRVVAIKRRGVPLDPMELRDRLTGSRSPDAEPVVVVLTRRGAGSVAVVCEPPTGR